MIEHQIYNETQWLPGLTAVIEFDSLPPNLVHAHIVDLETPDGDSNPLKKIYGESRESINLSPVRSNTRGRIESKKVKCFECEEWCDLCGKPNAPEDCDKLCYRCENRGTKPCTNSPPPQTETLPGNWVVSTSSMARSIGALSQYLCTWTISSNGS
jgi:hypothetical protein